MSQHAKLCCSLCGQSFNINAVICQHSSLRDVMGAGLCCCFRDLIAGLSKQLRSLELQAPHSLWSSLWSQIISQAVRDARVDGVLFPPGSFSLFLQQTLPQLTALTSLVVGELGDSSVLQYAPAQIKTLEWVAVGDHLALGGG